MKTTRDNVQLQMSVYHIRRHDQTFHTLDFITRQMEQSPSSDANSFSSSQQKFLIPCYTNTCNMLTFIA
jgi:hypothetical protein